MAFYHGVVYPSLRASRTGSCATGAPPIQGIARPGEWGDRVVRSDSLGGLGGVLSLWSTKAGVPITTGLRSPATPLNTVIGQTDNNCNMAAHDCTVKAVQHGRILSL